MAPVSNGLANSRNTVKITTGLGGFRSQWSLTIRAISMIWEGVLQFIRQVPLSWWRHKKNTFSALLAFFCVGNSPVTGEFPTKRLVTQSFHVFFDLRPNKWLSKKSRGWWFETPSCSLWRHCNVYGFDTLSIVDDAHFVWGIHRSPVNFPHKGQWRRAFMFALICARINGWANNPEAGDLRRHRAHYDVIVMYIDLIHCRLLTTHQCVISSQLI